jgi:hypothetical protein
MRKRILDSRYNSKLRNSATESAISGAGIELSFKKRIQLKIVSSCNWKTFRVLDCPT